MKKSLITIAVVIVVAFAGYFAWRGRDTNTSVGSGERSLSSLLAAGNSVQCTFKADKTGDSAAFIAAGKARIDFTSPSGDTMINGHMIVSNNVAYSWIDGSKTGFKISTGQTTEHIDAEANISADAKYKYDCKAWVRDETKFQLPKEVTFTEFSAPMPSTNTNTSGDVKTNQCAACDRLPTTQKASCRTALGCK